MSLEQEAKMAASMRVGNVEIVALIDVDAAAPWRALFPQLQQDDWEPYREHLTPDGKSLSMTITSYLVRSQGKTILVDTGVGDKDRPFFPKGRLPDAMREVGVNPGDIEIVLATHIHVDHVGWHTRVEGESFVPMFPSSKYVFNRGEWDFFTSDEEAAKEDRHYVRDCVLPLRDLAQVDLVEGEHALTDEIHLLPTPGHTPAHVSVAIASAGETGIIIGDVCHHPAQAIETEWSPIFDMNPVLAKQTRGDLMKRIEDERLLMAAGHFPTPGFGRLVRVDGRRSWRAL